MNKYQSGVRYERICMQILEKQGYYCQRSAGSHKIFDVLATYVKPCNPDELPLIRFIQVKSGKTRPLKKDCMQVANFYMPNIISKELWYFKHHKHPEIRYF